MKYPIGTRIQSLSSPPLTGTIIGYDEEQANIVEWRDGHRPNWRNKWFDSNIDNDRDKILTKPIFPEELFTL